MFESLKGASNVGFFCKGEETPRAEPEYMSNTYGFEHGGDIAIAKKDHFRGDSLYASGWFW